MSTDHRTVRTRPTAVVTVLLAVFFMVAGPGTASAGTETETVSPTERIVAALEESPVHVDPSFSGALPEDRAHALVERINGSEVPLRVLAVPLIEGGDWSGDAEQMIAAVHDRIGGPAHYLVLDGRAVSGHDFETGHESSDQRAFYAALSVSYELGHDAPAVDQVDRGVEIALSEDPAGIYADLVEAQEKSPRDWLYSLGPGAYTVVRALPWALAVLALAGLGFGVYRWRRPRAVPAVPQHAAFDNADRARLESLVERAERDLIDLGERLHQDSSAAPRDVSRALDARDAAARVLDRMVAEGPTLPDAAGVLVLLDRAEDALAGLRSPRRPCYANPLHGTRTEPTQWREFGGSRTVRVPLCAECAGAVRLRVRPTVLPAGSEGREVPYYEVPAEESVWAATGYGSLRDDLVERILRGEHAGRG